jgi:hypothetical protein
MWNFRGDFTIAQQAGKMRTSGHFACQNRKSVGRKGQDGEAARAERRFGENLAPDSPLGKNFLTEFIRF